MTAKKGDWVQIVTVVLTPEQRAPQIPEDTRRMPLKMWAKGILTHDAKFGETAEIQTDTGRKITGVLEEVNPSFTHSFGSFVPELAQVRTMLKIALYGEDENG